MSDAKLRLFAMDIVDHQGKGAVIGVVAKRTYRVRAGACVVADDQVPLVEAPVPAEGKPVLLHDADTFLGRTQADVVVVGKARSQSGERVFDVRVRVDALDRCVRVFGDRRCSRDTGGHVRFSDPAPIEEIDLGWESAYGGVDAVALARYGDPVEKALTLAGHPYRPAMGSYAYPRNRAGKGYVIEASPGALERCALPNLEEPTRLLTPETLAIGQPNWWPGGPIVAGLGWLSYAYFPRAAMMGALPPFDAKRFPPASFLEIERGALNRKALESTAPLGQRFDLAIAQQSAIGMRTVGVAPGAPVALERIHRSAAVWSFALSREVPRMSIKLPGSHAIELMPAIRNVLVEPELDRVSVTWVGEHVEAQPIGPGKRARIVFAATWGGERVPSSDRAS